MAVKPNVLILRAPGTNCDVESAFAFEQAGAAATACHINQLMESPEKLEQFQVLCLPGGFSYGDDIGAGKVLASQLMNRLADVMHDFVNADKLVLGICNGFQVLIKSGLLIANDDEGPKATLTWNDSGVFIDKWVGLATASEKCVFLNGVERLYLPIAHAEGKFVTRDQATMDGLKSNDQIALRYAATGSADEAISNPNGSQEDIAGLCDPTGRVFGLMPHPERHIHPTHHPNWTRSDGELPAEGEGMAIFRNAVRYFED